MRPILVALVSGTLAAGIALALPTLFPLHAQQPGGPGLPGASGQPPLPLLTQQRVHGTIQDVDGPTLTFKADDGRTLTVDMSQIGADIRGALTPGEGATVVGIPGDEPHRLTARYIQQVPPREPSPRLPE